jgi:hypothetical protein
MSTVARTQSADQTERLILAARELLKPTEVRLHHCPDWLRKVLLKVYGCRHRDTSAWGVMQHAFADAHWLDHWGSSRIGEKLCFVSEPYHVDVASQIQIKAIADRIGCNWYLSANSWWYPSQTIRIVIEPPNAAEFHVHEAARAQEATAL